MNTTITCIVLHKTKYSNSSLIVSVLSKEHGKQSILFKGIMSKKNKNYTLLNYLNILEIEIWRSTNSDLLIGKNISLIYN